MLWEQARQVAAQVEGGMSKLGLAAQWINARTGKPYSRRHVQFTIAVWCEHARTPRPLFRKAYAAVAHAAPDVVEPDRATDEEDEPDQEPSEMDVHFSSKTAEHYTPSIILDAVVACLGAIDLDPCSNADGPPNVPASRHCTATDDGLQRTWRGRVYMNPPYGSEIDAWVSKLCAEFASGRVTEAIALVPARTDTKWFAKLRDYICCFVTGRLTFIGNEDAAPFPSAVFYLGTEIETFYRTFADLGDIWQRIEPGMFGE